MFGRVLKVSEAWGFVWGGVYKRDFFQKVRFPAGYWYEDMINGFLLRGQAKNTTSIQDILYFYNKHSESISNTVEHSENYHCLDQIYLTKSLIQDYRKLGLNDEAYLFGRTLNECSSFAVNRTQKLDMNTRYQVFMACSEIISSFHFIPSGLTPKQKFSYEALINKDFRAWVLAARI